MKEGDIEVITANNIICFNLLRIPSRQPNPMRAKQKDQKREKKSEKNNTWIISTKLDNSKPTNLIKRANEAQ